MNDVVYVYDIVERKWKPDYSQEVPEPNWAFQAAVAHAGEVVQYFIEQYQYEQNKPDPSEYDGVEFQ